MSIISPREKRDKTRNRYISSSPSPQPRRSSRSRLAPTGATAQTALMPPQNAGIFRPVSGRTDFRKFGAWICTLGCAALLCGSLGLGLYKAYHFGTASDYFNVRRIDIH